ncbi:MAG: LTA synthase family protein [Bacilli bacterium]|nr:LTA synthase family protein [Bacilli bacterium]
MIKKIIKNFFVFLYIFIITLIYFSTKWALHTFEFLNFDEIVFQLTSPLSGTESTIMTSFYSNSLFPSIVFSVICFILIKTLYSYLSTEYLNINIMIRNKKFNFNIKTIILKIIITTIIIISGLCIINNSCTKLHLPKYLKSLFESSKFIEEHYVDPKEVKITFPDKKRNLVFIFAESFESSYFPVSLGGSNNKNPMEPLNTLTEENLNFSDNEKFGGSQQLAGTTWTTGAIVAYTTGLPVKIDPTLTNGADRSNVLNGATALGHILEKNGYNETFMMGSDSSFGSRKGYLKKHGNYYIYDEKEAKKLKKVPKDYHVWWGIEDKKLFEIAKDELTRLDNESKPFNFSILTTDTHFPGGFINKECTGYHYEDDYSNSVYCSAKEIRDFIEWIKKQSFYENTTIILVGDHLSMEKDYLPLDQKRRVYNLIINSPIEAKQTKNREFSSLDMFPTTLASMNVKIEGDRLGLGTNLYSDEKTLIEQYGYDKVNSELEKRSIFYDNKFIYNK